MQLALEVYHEYDLSLWDAWQVTAWHPSYADLDSSCPPDIHALAMAKVDERRCQRQQRRKVA